MIAANRLAKKYGIKTGTACFEAKRLCLSGVLCKTTKLKLTPQAQALLTDGVDFLNG